MSAARNTIDIVRAARHLPAAHTSDQYVVWGHSEGGQTAMFASNIGPAYAPELKLRGVVAGAPPSQFALIYDFLKTSPYRYYLLMAAGGLNAAYGDQAAPLDQVLTPAGMKLVPLLDQGCAGFLSQKIGNLDVAGLTKGDPFKNPPWHKVLEANDPQLFTKPSPAPLLIIQGGNDEQIPPVSTQDPRRPSLRPEAGPRTVDLSGREPLRCDRAVGRRHAALDLRPVRGRRESRSVPADGRRGHRHHDLPGLNRRNCGRMAGMDAVPRFDADVSIDEVEAALRESGCVVVERLVSDEQLDRIEAELEPYLRRRRPAATSSPAATRAAPVRCSRARRASAISPRTRSCSARSTACSATTRRATSCTSRR